MILDALATLADPVRARILAVLSDEELAVGELTRVLQLPQSTVSRHVKTLESAGWLVRRSSGTSSRVQVADTLPDALAPMWEAVRAAIVQTEEHQDDAHRLRSIIAARSTDSRTFFGRIHEGWDSVRRELFGEGFLLPTLLGLVDSRLRVADLGCGTGEAVATLAPHVQQVIGIDREQKMLDIARERTAVWPGIELRCGSLTDLPLDDDAVDATLCMLVLHHIEDLDGVLSEMARVLRPGGRAVVLDMLAHRRTEYAATMGHVHLGFDPDDLKARAAAAGLNTLRLTPLPAAPDAQGPPLFLAVFRTHST